MVWAAVCSRSYFFANCTELLLQLKKIQSIWFQYWSFCDIHVQEHLLGCWKMVFAMTSMCYHQNFALLHFALWGQTCLLLQVSLDFLHLHFNPLWRKGHLFLVFVLEGLVGLQEPLHFNIIGWSIDLDYHDIEWFALETNRDHSVVFEIASKYSVLDSFDDDGYSISSKGFLPTVVDIMVIWVKFTHSSPF